MDKIPLLATVRLTEGDAESDAQGIAAGSIGTVVEEYFPHGYLVEFTDECGRTQAVLALNPPQVEPLIFH